MNEPRKLRSDQVQREEEALESSQTSQRYREFGSVEELLRHDALHTPVPPRIGEKLKESLGPFGTATGERPWWRRFFRS